MIDEVDNINNLKHLYVKKNVKQLKGKMINWERVCKYMTRIITLLFFFKVKKNHQEILIPELENRQSIQKAIQYMKGKTPSLVIKEKIEGAGNRTLNAFLVRV